MWIFYNYCQLWLLWEKFEQYKMQNIPQKSISYNTKKLEQGRQESDG